jgi:phytoene dehydrogenase-like protein
VTPLTGRFADRAHPPRIVRGRPRFDHDVIVVGAGFGGLGAALTLAERGARVCVLEALTYPGGCASTFQRHGWRFEAGATLFSGFGEGHLMRRWIDGHGLDVHVEMLDPSIVFRAPGFELPVPPDRDVLVARLCALPGAPEAGIRSFFDEQRRVADALWALFADPSLLPPFSADALLRHAGRLGQYLPLVRTVGRPLIDVLRRHGVDGFLPLRTYLDALCQITVQTGVAEAEAPFALAATDYCFRGTGHVRGGIGVLARALCGAIERLGGEVHFASRAARIEPWEDGFRVFARGRELTAAHVVANLLPHGVRALVERTSLRLDTLAAEVEGGWGAVMLYLGLRPDPEIRPAPHHVEIVQDPALPFVEGNHLFCSVSGADEAGRGPAALTGNPRTVTVSTHVSIAKLRVMTPEAQSTFVADIQAHMRAGIRTFAPELDRAVVHAMTASPRTWQRFTRRTHGLVGGVPRRAGLQHYTSLVPPPPVPDLPGLWMVGDSVFPGQSTLAVAIGGVKVASRIAEAEGW